MRCAVALLVLAACGQSVSAVAIRTVPPPPLAPGAIRLERARCGPDALLMPAVLDGTLGWFVIDSGAFTNVVFEEFATRAKLTHVNNGERVGGGLGIPVATVELKSFAVPGLPGVDLRNFLMLSTASSPLARHACGVAGVISPALLATHDLAVVVDFTSAQLLRMPLDEVDAHLAAAGTYHFVAERTDSEYTAGIDVEIGARKLRLMVDTGACCTWVTTTSGVGRDLHPRSVARGNIGRLLGATPSRSARALLRFGDVGRLLDVRLLTPDENDARESGGLGADALRDCTIAILQTGMRGACR
ncbi:MAG: hypothetical protein KF773_27660 [Deltaproteobacteria bacterium]|nr:hypothetical protein [Deltaproteobacteria bacterium]MCW5803900.1 hypothetical protein [Deltaproteobacteria bacterium]